MKEAEVYSEISKTEEVLKSLSHEERFSIVTVGGESRVYANSEIGDFGSIKFKSVGVGSGSEGRQGCMGVAGNVLLSSCAYLRILEFPQETKLMELQNIGDYVITFKKMEPER